MMPGAPAWRTYDYVPYGTTSLSAALNTAASFVMGKRYKPAGRGGLDLLKEIDTHIPGRPDKGILKGWHDVRNAPQGVAGSVSRGPRRQFPMGRREIYGLFRERCRAIVG